MMSDMDKGKLLVLTGGSGSGKDSVMRELVKMGWSRVVTHTAGRDPRPGEVDGQDYHFVSREKFEEMKNNGEFLEWVVYGETLKGTSKKEVENVLQGKKVVWRIDATAAAKVEDILRKGLGDEAGELISGMVVVYLKAEDENIIFERALRRDNIRSLDIISSRIDADKKEWEENREKFKNVVINKEGALHQTVEQVLKIAEEKQFQQDGNRSL